MTSAANKLAVVPTAAARWGSLPAQLVVPMAFWLEPRWMAALQSCNRAVCRLSVPIASGTRHICRSSKRTARVIRQLRLRARRSHLGGRATATAPTQRLSERLGTPCHDDMRCIAVMAAMLRLRWLAKRACFSPLSTSDCCTLLSLPDCISSADAARVQSGRNARMRTHTQATRLEQRASRSESSLLLAVR